MRSINSAPSSARRCRNLVWLALSWAGLLLGGCGTGSAVHLPGVPPVSDDHQAAPPALPALPAPAQLRRPSKVVVNVANGADFDPSSSHNTAASATDATFSPSWTAQAQAAGNLAYAAFTLEPDVASVAPLLHLAWRSAPQVGQCWVAIGDFNANTWIWHQWAAGQDFALDLQAKNINTQTGTVPFVVLLTGNTSAKLGRVRIGANQPPQVQLNLTAPQGPAPINLVADAGATADPDGLIVKYEYDLDGDGTFDQTTTQPIVNWQQAVDGSYQCYLQVTDDDGATGSAEVDYDTGYHKFWTPPGGPGTFLLNGIAALPSGGYYVAGYGLPTIGSNNFDLMLLKFTASGGLEWARGLGKSAEADFGGAVAAAADGSVYVTGTMNIAAGVGTQLLAHYFADGTLDWQRSWGANTMYPRGGLAVDGGSGAVLVASSLLIAPSVHAATLQRYSGDGQWQWTRGWNSGADTYSIGVGADSLDHSYLGVTYLSGSYLRSGVIQFDATGTQLAKAAAGSATFGLQGNALAVNPAGRVALVGEYMSPTEFGPFAVVLDSGMSKSYSYYLPNPGTEDSFNCAKFAQADGRLWCCGTLSDTPDFEGGLAFFSPNGANYEVYRMDAPGGKAGLSGLDFAPGGGLLLVGNVSATTQLDPLARDVAPLVYDLTVPMPNALPDNTAPLVSTYPSATLMSAANPSGGGIVYKFYQPLE